MTERITHEEARAIIRDNWERQSPKDGLLSLMRYVDQQAESASSDTVSFAADPDFVEVYKYQQNPDTGRVRIRPTELRAAGWVPRGDTVSRAEHERVVAELRNALQETLDKLNIRHQEYDELWRKCETERARAEELTAEVDAKWNRALQAEEQLAAANARAGRLEEENARLRDAINIDRTGLAAGLNHLKAIASGYRWIPDGEWGSYDYTQRSEATLREEVGHLITGVVSGADRYLKASGERATAALSTAPQAPTEQASPSPAVGEEAGHRFPDSWAERRFCSRCGVSWEARGSESCKPSPSPQVAQAAGHVCDDDDDTRFCPACDAAYDAELSEIQPAQPAPGGTERPCPKCNSLDKFCSVLGCIEEEPTELATHMTAADFSAISSTDDDDPTPAEPQGRPEQAGDRPVDVFLLRAWKHHEVSRERRNIRDGRDMTQDDHAFIELWHAVRVLAERGGR